MADQTRDELDALTRRDPRYKLIDTAFAVGAELRDSSTLKFLMERIKSDADNEIGRAHV